MKGEVRSFVAGVLSAIHVGIMLLFLIGWALPWRGALVAVVVGALVVEGGWFFSGDRCWLTVFQERLRGRDAPPVVRLAADAERPPSFIADLATSSTSRPSSPSPGAHGFATSTTTGRSTSAVPTA